ncbi:MAG: PEP-CTERM sorting domain-containing protein [Planctomycetes bacterium]|jgi:hypothetical protein|nr:PEP-CTERM sorting domain-containing protein [Planctomycetota bacterium]
MKQLVMIVAIVAMAGIASAGSLVGSRFTYTPEDVSELLETTGSIGSDWSKDGFLDTNPGDVVNPSGLVEMHFKDWRKNVRWVFDYVPIAGLEIGQGTTSGFGGYGIGYYSTMYPSFEAPRASSFQISERPIVPPPGFEIGEGAVLGEEGDIVINPTPEPLTAGLLLLGAVGLVLRRRSNRY